MNRMQADPNGELQALYERIALAASEVSTNTPRKDIPVVLEKPRQCRLLPATSLAIQSLIPIDTPVHAAFLAVRERYLSRFPEVVARSFWQPPGTFHLNVAILKRLVIGTTAPEEIVQVVATASNVLQWLDTLPAYSIRFQGLLLAPDGTLMAKGYALNDTPWLIRRRFVAEGFPDQQKMLHVTLGRILEALTPERWQQLLSFNDKDIANQDFGVLSVQEAFLIHEREGFLHTPSCYNVLRRYRWAMEEPIDEHLTNA